MSQKVEVITVTIKGVEKFHNTFGESKNVGVLLGGQKLPDGFKPEWMFRAEKTNDK